MLCEFERVETGWQCIKCAFSHKLLPHNPGKPPSAMCRVTTPAPMLPKRALKRQKLAHGATPASDELLAVRLAICATCAEHETGMCRAAKCCGGVPAREVCEVAANRCPRKKWQEMT